MKASGLDVDGLRAKGRLVMVDAEEAIGQIAAAGIPDPRRFEEVIGSVTRAASAAVPARRVRAYGEMVDLLWQAGHLRGALRLEAFWHDLIRRQPITLLCAYQMGLLDGDTDGSALEEVCAAHNEAFLSEDRARLDRAVAAALEEALGTSRVRSLAPLIEATAHSNEHLGAAERTIFWLRRNLPTEHSLVLDRARALFRTGA